MVKVVKGSLSIIGRNKALGMTFYKRGNEIIGRSCYKSQPSHQTPAQFRSRERMRRLIALWNCFKGAAVPVMETHDGIAPYKAFIRLNYQAPATFLTRSQSKAKCAVLVPGLCISSGRLDSLSYDFETLPDGRRLVVTNLLTGLPADQTQPIGANTSVELRDLLFANEQNEQLQYNDTLVFYRLKQVVDKGEEEDLPTVTVESASVPLTKSANPYVFLEGHQLYTHKGFLAIAGADDPDAAYAVVLSDARRNTVSTQTIITTSTYYEAFTTDEALARAVNSYGNVREGIQPSDDLQRGHSLIPNG